MKQNVKVKAFGLAKGNNVTSDDFYDVRIFEDIVIGVLADGVGSALKGGVASRRIVNTLIESFKNRPSSWSISKALEHFISSINRTLYLESIEDYGRPEMVSTLAVVVLEGERLYGANVGDSRIYLVRDEQLMQLSNDHSLQEAQMQHVLTQAMGLTEKVIPFYFENIIVPGDKILLCSDGLYTLMQESTLMRGVQQQAHFLVKQASKMCEDNLPDDTSAITIDMLGVSPTLALKKLDLKIPEQLRSGDNFDGYILQEALIQNECTWLCEKEDEVFVIKFAPIEARDDDKVLDLFIQEAWNANRLKAGFFAKAWIPENRSARYYLMEFINGSDLKKQLNRKQLGIDMAIDLAKFLLKANSFLATYDLCHGDIKPENIMITERHGKKVFKLVDFGSVVELFSTTSRAGTPSYLAPERFSGEMINERTEIFAIGVTLYESLCGKFPYGEIEPFQNPIFKMPIRPRKLNKNIPEWLESVILFSIERDKERRYNNYSEMIYALDHPEKCEAYFNKGASLIEKDPTTFYKVAFFSSLVMNGYLLVNWLSS